MHKNKTTATLLASTLGWTGAHRFYLRGRKDPAGWLLAASFPLSLWLQHTYFGTPGLLTWSPMIAATLTGLISALFSGLQSDEKWDAHYNTLSEHPSASGWQLALILVLTAGLTAILILAILARALDLMLTGGAYG